MNIVNKVNLQYMMSNQVENPNGMLMSFRIMNHNYQVINKRHNSFTCLVITVNALKQLISLFIQLLPTSVK